MARGRGVNTENAHIRQGSPKRESSEVHTAEAERLLNDPAFQRAFKTVRESCVNLLENLQHDGTPEMDRYEREICRTLRTMSRLRRAIGIGVQGQMLRLADFKPLQDKED